MNPLEASMSTSLMDDYKSTTPPETPQTPPSPLTTPGDGLTPPSPQSTPSPTATITSASKLSTETRAAMKHGTLPSQKFTSPTSKKRKSYTSSSSTITTTSRTMTPPNSISSSKRRPQSNSKQLYIDLGQSKFGQRTICRICNMLYVNGIKEDEENHVKICSDYLYGVPFHMWKHSRVVYRDDKVEKKVEVQRNLFVAAAGQGGGGRRIPASSKTGGSEKGCIIEVRDSDLVQLRQKVLQVKNIVEQELGFVNSESCSFRRNSEKVLSSSLSSLGGTTAYLYIQHKRVIGYCIVESISKAFQLHNSNDDNNCNENFTHNSDQHHSSSISNRSNKSTKGIMGVYQLWCHKSHRKKSIASALIDTARSKFVYGYIVPITMVAFSSPTTDGMKFAKQYCNTDTPLVYDYYNKFH